MTAQQHREKKNDIIKTKAANQACFFPFPDLIVKVSLHYIHLADIFVTVTEFEFENNNG